MRRHAKAPASSTPAGGATGHSRRTARWIAALAFALAALALPAPASAAPATATTGAAIHVGTESAYLTGTVNPGGESTVYWFEFGAGNCATTACTAVPATKRQAGEGAGDVAASFGLGGLSPSTTYHFRLLAENASGLAVGGDRTFTTQSVEEGCLNEARRAEQGSEDLLGNCRAWELATPDSNVDVLVDSGRTVAAAGAPGLPMAVKFSSLGGFGEVEGGGIAFDYLAQRSGAPGTSGWAFRGITPRQQPLTFLSTASGYDPLYELFSPDLGQGIFRSYSSLPGTSDNALEVPNLYRRDDLRDPGPGSYELLTDSFAPQPPVIQGTGAENRPWIAGASADLHHVLFESKRNLTADATGANTKLYKSDDGIVRLVRASGACAGFAGLNGKAPCSVAGLSATALSGGPARYTPRVISADGSRVNFTSPFGTGSATTIPNPTAGIASKLYQLDDRGTATGDDDALIQLNRSENPVPEAARAAFYETASVDGERVFFRSVEQLTEEPGSGLYLWERRSENEEQSLSIDATGGSFTLTAHSQPSVGPGELTSGSTTVFMKMAGAGSFTVGQAIEGEGIPAGATVTEVGSFNSNPANKKIVISQPASETGTRQLSADLRATTGPLPWDATAEAVEAALEGLGSIGAGNVSVGGVPGGPYQVEFTGGLAGVDVMELSADPAGLSGGSSTAMVTTAHEIRNLTLIAPGATGVLGASEGGHRIYFAIGSEIWLWQDGPTTPGQLYHVAALPSSSLLFQIYGPLSTFWNQRPLVSRVAPDGGTLLFESADGGSLPPGYRHGSCDGNVLGINNGFCAEAYLYRAATSTPDDPDIVCASCDLATQAAPGDTDVNVRDHAGASLTASHLSRALTDDGRRAFFNTAEALVAEDTNGAVDVYEYDTATGEAHLISGGEDLAPSFLMDASADGSDVFFVTRARLSAWDDDNAYDLYDARAGGGFPEPPDADSPCAGESCKAAAPAAAAAPEVATASLRGAGNPRARRRCGKGRHLVRKRGKARCVKKHPKHERRRNADTNRRAGK